MVSEDVTRIAEEMVAAWNARDVPTFVEFLTEDVEWEDPAMAEPAQGRQAVANFTRAVLRAFPDFRYSIRHPLCVASDGSRCAVPWRISATHLRRLDPPGYRPTGQHAEFEGVDLLEFRGRRVCRIVTFFNVLVPAEQLLAWRLRPRPGTWQERFFVWVQSFRAVWLRATRRAPAR